MPDFIPASDDSRKTWCTNFAAKLATHGGAVGLTPAQRTALSDKCNEIIGRIDAKEAARTAWQSSVAAADQGNAADFGEVRAAVAAMKTHAGYSESIGADLGVVGGGGSFDPSTYQAEIGKAELSGPGMVTIKFSKAGGSIDGVNVYSRRQGQGEWKFLARDTRSPYIDTTPLTTAGTPEVREYRVRGVVNDEEIGEYSATVQVTVT